MLLSDPAITSFATQNWTSHLGFEETSHWRPWTIDGCQQMGGYVEQYEGMFDFVTIRGAGTLPSLCLVNSVLLCFLRSWWTSQFALHYLSASSAINESKLSTMTMM